MPEILAETSCVVFIIACSERDEQTQEEIAEVLEYANGRAIIWYNMYTMDGLHAAMFRARGSAVMLGRISTYVHTMLHLYDD